MHNELYFSAWRDMRWDKMCTWCCNKGEGSQYDIVEKIALNPICCIVNTSLHGGTWGGMNVYMVLQLMGHKFISDMHIFAIKVKLN